MVRSFHAKQQHQNMNESRERERDYNIFFSVDLLVSLGINFLDIYEQP
jgi:hypothetical protein